ncbi:hypothetical protein CC1G_09670 [Coprinopsis cinerea okayama7|uniref:F-box domain-containing protein n=1 Tax=Coprinopsis cinerea (strain Okayama-7 / 130 / ATCC MYA-4618 / FGSC 9003) TaxID=240176 RepID=A8P9G6_COPC7|nr:hypothetical protein CC1G_09670 [Coprinopsis cinerea okayama7\|eukprot:XP_001839767.1 hypothetical protein CC1G_09670 [Coprinopsis cinerea okayama7\
MTQVPRVPPELISQIVKSAKATFDPKELARFLSNGALVSRVWYDETRPLAFSVVVFDFGRPDWNTPLGLDETAKIRGLLHLIQINPKLALYVQHLELSSPLRATSALDQLKACGPALLDLCLKLKDVTVFKIKWSGDGGDTRLGRQSWWFQVGEEIQSAVQHVCSLRSLHSLSTENISVPLSAWIYHPSLKVVSTTCHYILEGKRSLPIQDGHPEKYASLTCLDLSDIEEYSGNDGVLTILTRDHIGLFRSLVDLTLSISMNNNHGIRRVLEVCRETLTSLTYRPIPILQPGPTRLNIEYHAIDFSAMAALRRVVLAFQPPYETTVESCFPVLMATLTSLPWRQLEVFELTLSPFGFRSDLLPNLQTPTFDPRIYTRPIDALAVKSPTLKKFRLDVYLDDEYQGSYRQLVIEELVPQVYREAKRRGIVHHAYYGPVP